MQSLLNDSAEIYFALGRYREAEPLIMRAVAILQAAHGPDHPDVAIGLNKLGWLCQAMGTNVVPRAPFEHALAIGEAALVPDHPNVPIVLGNLASPYQATSRRTEAVELEARADAIRARWAAVITVYFD